MDVLGQLIEDLSDGCVPAATAREQAERAGDALRRCLQHDGWLPAELQRTEADGYCRRIVHADEEGRFTLMVMSWRPGQSTPIHDHIAWCTVVVYCGEEEIVDYSLHDEPSGPVLVERRRSRPRRGECEVLVPPAENIHRVTCVGPGPSVSLHVYGADIRRLGSSINRTFDHLPVRERAAVAAGSWRQPAG